MIMDKTSERMVVIPKDLLIVFSEIKKSTIRTANPVCPLKTRSLHFPVKGKNCVFLHSVVVLGSTVMFMNMNRKEKSTIHNLMNW
ncbi:hypothetical protein SAGO17_00105 [Mimivirus AB-566-O17]|uniref:Uncharacterized protein n=1 Tax=Mimivirus AB-566-O17 TaxID=1988039 RepID=A0A1X9VNW1_9VIRU|nr:hypothetical protein SAGO17_00105 [Mimivirus AB-566-O17]